MDSTAIIVAGSLTSTVFLISGLRYGMCVDRRLKARGLLLVSVGEGAQVVMNILLDNMVGASIMAAVTAIGLWVWWNNGGGDGMRKKLKSLKGYFGFRLALQGA